MSCGTEFMDEEPQMCCSGRDCGCHGMPIDPIICSEHCYYSLPFMKHLYLKWFDIKDKLPNNTDLHSKLHKDSAIEVIIRYEYYVVGFDDTAKEKISTAYYVPTRNIFETDEGIPISNVTHFMYLPKSPL